MKTYKVSDTHRKISFELIFFRNEIIMDMKEIISDEFKKYVSGDLTVEISFPIDHTEIKVDVILPNEDVIYLCLLDVYPAIISNLKDIIFKKFLHLTVYSKPKFIEIKCNITIVET